jgi:hypothetical protein
VYEVDPLLCPCGERMRVVGFIAQAPVIGKILTHIGRRDGPGNSLAGRRRVSTTSPPTRSQGLTIHSKATRDWTSPLLPFHSVVRRARGFRVAHHPIARILAAKGCRMRRRAARRGISYRTDRPGHRIMTDGRVEVPYWMGSEKRKFLSGMRGIHE